MSVLVDTVIWTLALRRRRRDLNPLELRLFYEWERLLLSGEAALIGPTRQEALSGLCNPREFNMVRERLAVIDELAVDSDTFILAAEFYNTCRAAGIAPGPLDMTLCAAAHTHHVPIFTVDPDFPRYATCLPIRLHSP